MELLTVIVIIAALAALVVSNMDRSRDDAETVASRATMQIIREALTGSAAGPGYLADMKYVPGFNPATVRIHDLLVQGTQPAFDPVVRRGWRGPYVRNPQGVANTNPARNGHFPAAGERRTASDGTFLERGLYLDSSTSLYGLEGDSTAADPWGNPIVIQYPSTGTETERAKFARLVSAGPDGILSTPNDRLAGMLANGTATARGDDLVLFLNRTDAYE